MSLLKAAKNQIGIGLNALHNFIFDASAQDGTLTLKRENGQEVMRVASTGKTTFPQNTQTWVDVTANRLANTSYVNDTGLPIHLAITLNAVGPGSRTLFVGSLQFRRDLSNAPQSSISFDVVVPAGAAYSFNGSFTIWLELRN